MGRGSETIREVAQLYIRRQRQAVARCDDTSLTSCWILGELGRSGELTLRELAEAIGYDKSWTSRVVETLAAEGLIAKKSHPTDARCVSLALTRRGQARFDKINNALDEDARDVVRLIQPEKRAMVNEALALVLEALRAEVMSCR